MSKKLPWYKRDVDAWRGGTRSMSFELRGFYSELLDAMWDLQGPIPSDPQRLGMIISGNPRTIRKLLPQLLSLGKLQEGPGGLINKRMEAEIAGNNSKGIQGEFRGNSSGIQREFERKNPKNPMFSTRDLEEEKEEDSKGDFDFQKSEVERKRREAEAYERQLEEVERGTIQ